MSWEAAAIAGGAQLASGLLGKGKTKTQWDFAERSRLEKDRFKWLVRGAKRAGFNPLTVLGATGGQMGGGPVATASPFTARQAVGDAIAAATNAYLSTDPIAQETAKLENQLLRKQIDQYENEAGRFGTRPIGSSVPQVRSTASPVSQSVDPETGLPTLTDAAGNATPTPNTLVMAGDEVGELETLAMGAAAQGQLGEFARQLLELNLPTGLYNFGADVFNGITYIPRWLATEAAAAPARSNNRVTRKPIIRAPDDRQDAKARRTSAGW